MKAIDLTGQRFGRLTVLERAENKGAYVCWKCRCDCGIEKIIAGYCLKSGKTQSCGCLQIERTAEAHTTHGKYHTRLHGIWTDMKARCNNPNRKAYKDYGGRGITVCEEWHNSFETFYEWAMANGYSDDLTIDRIDNDKGYSPDNCRWATMADQNKNKRAGGHKLTKQQVENIRAEYRKGERGFGCVSLAKKYNVTTQTIHGIITNKIWRES